METFTHKKINFVHILLIGLLIIATITTYVYKGKYNSEVDKKDYYKNQLITMHEIADSSLETTKKAYWECNADIYNVSLVELDNLMID